MSEQEIYIELMNRPDPADRGRYLDQVCAGNEPLRNRVEKLIRQSDQLGSFLEHSPHALAATADLSVVSEQPGALLGPYKLLEQIGEGGMGVVYMAQQIEPVKRKVALKVIKPGMDTRQVIARFEAERQALALMDHPNIARIYDAGTTGERRASVPACSGTSEDAYATGRPYFVMELVRGIPITDYCDKQRLNTQDRLKLFLDVCQAVQHAHQRGIIHRDLKPSNVLVTLHDGSPVVKVIDFGVAKALNQELTERTLFTQFSQMVGTPLYMSPEQAELSGLDIDTRTDVYSLGVLLYELLTGTTPFDKDRLKSATFDEMRRIIREEEPETVSNRIARTRRVGSAHQQQNSPVRNTDCEMRDESANPKSKIQNLKSFTELDWIAAKSLEKDRSRRYESASALASDLQRYLSGDPVLAHPPTTMYRFQKFARKHKAALTTAAALTLCLLLGTTVSAWQAVRATTAEAHATAHADQAKASAQQAKEKAAEATAQRDEAQRQRDEVKALADKLAAKEEQLERTMYSDHIYMAKEAWDRGNVTRASSLLKQHLPEPGETDRRGFEWHYLNRLRQLGPLFSIDTGLGIYGPDNPKLTPDRTRLIRFFPGRTIPGAAAATARIMERFNSEPTLKVWNLQTGKEELSAKLAALPKAVNSPFQIVPRFSPDATRMAIDATSWNESKQAYIPGAVKVWDTQTGREALSLSGVIEAVVFSPDSKLLATPMEDNSIKLWDTRTSQERLTLKGLLELPHAIAFSSDGKHVAAAGNKWDKSKKASVAGEIKIWDVQTGEQVQTLKGHSEWMHRLVFSPDGQCLASCAERTALIKLWNVNAGNQLKSFQLDTDNVDELQFSADGARLIGSGDKKEQDDYVDHAKMWNTQTGQELLSFKNCSLSFTPDGKRVAVEDWEKSRTKVFDAQSGQQVMNVAGSAPTFSFDSKRLAVISDGLRIWDLETGDEINHLKSESNARTLAFNQDGTRLIANSGSIGIQVWDVEAKQVSTKKFNLRGLNRQSGLVGPSPAVFNADFTRVAGISYRKIKIFDGQNGQELRTLPGHDSILACVAITSDGKWVASSDGGQLTLAASANSGVVKVWNADTGSELFAIKGLERPIGYLAFSPDGKKLAGSANDRTVKIWDAQSGREIHTFGAKFAGMYSIGRLVFSPDSKRLVAAAKIWDVESGQEIVTPKGKALGAAQSSIAFSPDGKRFAGGLGTIADAETGEPLFSSSREEAMSGSPWLTFSPDRKRLASSKGIWDAQTGQELLSFGESRGRPSGQVIFSPDGHRLAIVPFNGNEVTIYDATPLPEKP